MHKVCLGCGVPLQSQNKDKKGYIPKEKKDGIYCERCFRLLHYHERKLETLEISNEEILAKGNEQNEVIYFFVDFLELSDETISLFHQISGKKHFILTKIDLLPKSTSIPFLIEKIKSYYNIEEILPYTKKSKTMLEHILKQMKEEKKVLLFGMTNAGKSSFVKEVYHYYKEECPVLTSEMPNTTRYFLTWKIKNITMTDAPGFSYQTKWPEKSTLEAIPTKGIRPITIQMKKETKLIFENMLLLEQKREANSITFYGNNTLSLEKTYKKENEFQKKNTILVPSKSDLVFPGICFFRIHKKTEITIYTKEELNFEIRPSLFGGIK